MITLKRFRRIEAAVRAAGYGDSIDWTEALKPPNSADDFASQVAFVIISSGLGAGAAQAIYQCVMTALACGQRACDIYRHPGKAEAIDLLWRDRDDLFAAFQADDDPLAFAAELPWVGPITRYHLAKNFGQDLAKPDIHLARLAAREGVTPQQLCARLARQTGYRIATVDTILWRACAEGLLNSANYFARGWAGSFKAAQAECRADQAL